MNAQPNKPKAAENVDKPLEEERKVNYTPIGGAEEIELTIGMVRKYLTQPTSKGRVASDADVIKFMMLCKARSLNPWEGDAYLLGYDVGDSGAVFNLITAIQALLKRAEMCPEFDGLESGICVFTEDKQVVERAGTLVLNGETILGGWAKCHRKDRRFPANQTVQLTVYNTNLSRWKKDPAGMIQKVAKAAALREAFPTHLADMRTQDEMDLVMSDKHTIDTTAVTVTGSKPRTASELVEQLKQGSRQPAALPEPREQIPLTVTKASTETRISKEELIAELRSVRDPLTIEDVARDCKLLSPEDQAEVKTEIERAKARL